MKKTLLILVTFIVGNLSAQELPLFEDSRTINKSTDNLILFEDFTQKSESYFSSRDIDKKGSGYKPFKRWEYHWRHYLQEDGTIAPVEHLWKAWERKNKMEKSTTAVSNWTDSGPFDQSSKSGQGRINTVVVDPNIPTTIYVGAPSGGLWKSSDDGINWTPLTDDLPQIGVSGIALVPNNDPTKESDIIYISTGDDDAGDSYSSGVFKSLDGGLNWSPSGSILGSPISSNEIVIDPSDIDRIWVATSNGLFLSTNAGISWQQKQSGHIRDFKLKPGDPTTIYAVSENTFYRSTNGGSSFSIISTGLPNTGSLGRLRVEVTPASPDNVYILGAKPQSQSWAFEGLYTSTDSGSSFTKTAESDDIFGSTQAWYDLALAVSDLDASNMFVGVLDIWKSSNEGDNFSKINDWRFLNSTFTHADIHFMRYYDGVLYAGTDGGVYRSTDNGSSFTDLSENLSISQFYRLSVSKQSSNKMAGGLQDNGGFALNNTIWHNYHGGDGMDAASDPNDENTFYGFTQFGGALSITNNTGLSSSFVTSSPVQGNWVTPLVMNKASELYAGYGQLYKLVNNTWTLQSSHNFGGNLEAIEIDPSNNDNIFVSVGTSLFISNDRGENFIERDASQTGISGFHITSIEVHNSNSNVLWVTTSGVNTIFGPSSGFTGGGVFMSEDGGQTFTDITRNLRDEAKFVVRHHPFTTDNSIYLGTALGVYHLNDNSPRDGWELFSTNLPNVAISDLEINPYDATISAATYGRSVWQSPIPTITLPANEAELIKITPTDNTLLCGNFSPLVNVFNNGTNAITSLTINYNIDGGTNQIFNWTGNIPSNSSDSIELPNINSTEGIHTISVELIQVNDANTFNNSSSSTYEVNQSGLGQVTYTFGDANPEVNENNGSWLTSTDFWSIGTPTTTAFNGLVDMGYVTNPGGNYADGMVGHLTSPCYDMTILENPVLKFKMAFDIELNWDVLYMEYTTDGGTTWEVLGTANDPNWYNSSFQDPGRELTIGKQWTGTDTTLKDYSYDLSDFNNESSMMFRFVFKSDAAVNQEGAIIDDFLIDATQVLGVDDLDVSSFSIYPNPSNSTFNIKRGDFLGEKMTISVFDLTGKLIQNRKDIIKSDYPLDLSGVSKGVYFMRISIDNRSLVKKLILK